MHVEEHSKQWSAGMDDRYALGSYGFIFDPQNPFVSPISMPHRLISDLSSGKPLDLKHSGDETSVHDIEQETDSDVVVVPIPQLPPNIDNPEGERVFEDLWHHVWHFPRYRFYRGEGKSNKRRDNEVWPLDKEEAFWRAIAYFPPRAKRKVWNSAIGSNLGRNESIAAYINEVLNLVPNPDKEAGGFKALRWPKWDDTPEQLQARQRKNISSKLQVLKDMFRDKDPFVYDWIQGDHNPPSERNGSSKQTRSSSGGIRKRSSERRNPFSRIDNMESFESLLEQITPYMRARHELPILKSQPALPPVSLVSQFEFRMSLIDSNRSIGATLCGGPSSLHVFTKTVPGGGKPDTRLSSAELLNALPEMAKVNPLKHSDCPLIFAEASLDLPSEEFTLDSLDLAIDGKFVTAYKLDVSCSWYCRTVFYDGQYVHEPPEQILQDINNVNEQGAFCHSLPFSSKFWVRKVEELIQGSRSATRLEREMKSKLGIGRYEELKNRLGEYKKVVRKRREKQEDERSQQSNKNKRKKNKNQNQSRDDGRDDVDVVYDEICVEEDIRRYLKSVKERRDKVSAATKILHARQEILAYPAGLCEDGNVDNTPTTHLIICWRFRQTWPDEIGVTQFRKLLLTLSDNDLVIPKESSLNITLQYGAPVPEYTPNVDKPADMCQSDSDVDGLVSTGAIENNFYGPSSFSFQENRQLDFENDSSSALNTGPMPVLKTPTTPQPTGFEDFSLCRGECRQGQTTAGRTIHDQNSLYGPTCSHEGEYLYVLQQMDNSNSQGKTNASNVNDFNMFAQPTPSDQLVDSTTSTFPESSYALASQTPLYFNNDEGKACSSPSPYQYTQSFHSYPTQSYELSFYEAASQFANYGSQTLEYQQNHLQSHDQQSQVKWDEQPGHNLRITQSFTPPPDDEEQTNVGQEHASTRG